MLRVLRSNQNRAPHKTLRPFLRWRLVLSNPAKHHEYLMLQLSSDVQPLVSSSASEMEYLIYPRHQISFEDDVKET